MKQRENRTARRSLAMVIAAIALLALTALPVTAQAAQQAERTVLLYICGSNLETASGMATYNLQQILGANFSQSGRVKVVVMTGGSDQWHLESNALADPNELGLESEDGAATISSTYNQVWEARGADAAQNPGQMVLLDADGITGAEGTSVKSEDELMSDPKTLKAFIDYGMSNFPAEKYDLILWDHGGGPTGGFARDDHSLEGGTMSLSQIMKALSDNQVVSGGSGGKFDFIDFDACLMASADIALLMADYADYYIASPETEPGYGQDYEGWLNALGKDPAMDTYQLGKQIVDDFIDFYNKDSGDGAHEDGTLAVMDTKKLAASGLAEALTQIDAILRSQAEDQDASGELPFYDEMTAAGNSIQYGDDAYFDLGNLMGQLPVVQYEFSGGTPQLTNQYKDAATRITKILQDETIIYAGGTDGIGGEPRVYMNADGALKIGGLRTSGLYIFFPLPGDPGQSNTYWQEIAKAEEFLPADDQRRVFLERYRRTMLDYDLIGKTGRDVGDLAASGTDKSGISYASLCSYWKQSMSGMKSPWERIVQPLLEKRGGEAASEGWMSALIAQQATEAVSVKNAAAQKNEDSYHFTLSDVNKRVISDVHMDLIAELPAADEAKKALSPGEQNLLEIYPELSEYQIGSFAGEEYIAPGAIDTTDPEKQQASLIQWMKEPVSEWDVPLWDGKCYAIRDAEGVLHAAQVDTEEYSVIVQYADENSASGYSLAGLLFEEDGNGGDSKVLSEIALLDEDTGPVPIEPAALKADFDFMPVQYINLLNLKTLQLPMSASAIHVSKDNYQEVRLDYTGVENVKDIADTNGDGASVEPRVTVTDRYGSDADITDTIRAANPLKVNPLKVKGRTVRIKAGKLKKTKKKQTISRKKAVTVSKAVGKVTYQLTGVTKSKYKKYFKVNRKNGKITVKKGLKKGTYKLKIRVSAAGNAETRAAAKKATVTVRVR
ncbi:MAG: hypothetical protein IJ109_05640 [Firmicutes bacterium]|nr:hypothetical protein [Bacillota bacterium]